MDSSTQATNSDDYRRALLDQVALAGAMTQSLAGRASVAASISRDLIEQSRRIVAERERVLRHVSGAPVGSVTLPARWSRDLRSSLHRQSVLGQVRGFLVARHKPEIQWVTVDQGRSIDAFLRDWQPARGAAHEPTP